ncbi:hypothetical protein A2U01_0019087, partial [Trifolium medium]|nr:hypothetical protein [Trifolium medium]
WIGSSEHVSSSRRARGNRVMMMRTRSPRLIGLSSCSPSKSGFGQPSAQSRTGAPQIVAPRHRSNDFRICSLELVVICVSSSKYSRGRIRKVLHVFCEHALVKNCFTWLWGNADFVPATCDLVEPRGEIHADDNNELLVRRVACWTGFEKTDVSSDPATCVGYEKVSL